MLAQRISSINSLSALCEKTGADINEVSKAIGMDHRIGSKFLKASPGFGGSCFQKDILNLVYICQHYGLNEVANFWLQVININNYQRERIVIKVDSYVRDNSLAKKVLILGWAFKKDTNDSRESSSIYISYEFLQRGYEIVIYDPKIIRTRIITDLVELNNLRKNISAEIINEKIKVLDQLIINDYKSHPIIVLTEWDEFKEINYLSENYKIFDFRNIMDKAKTVFSL